jgi:hypothetical protein
VKTPPIFPFPPPSPTLPLKRGGRLNHQSHPTTPSNPTVPHCAWRRDHTAERDQRAYELLRTVIEERVYTKIKAMNQREHEERVALKRVDAA